MDKAIKILKTFTDSYESAYTKDGFIRASLCDMQDALAELTEHKAQGIQRHTPKTRGARQMKIAVLFSPFIVVFFLNLSIEQIKAVISLMSIIACTWFIAGAEEAISK